MITGILSRKGGSGKTTAALNLAAACAAIFAKAGKAALTAARGAG